MKAFQMILAVSVLGGISNMPGEAKAQNPIVGGDSYTDVYYDPFSDHTYVNRERTSVRASAFDPGRSYVDPGSQRYIDRYFRDNNGQTVHEFGWTWTSYGRPHGKLTRQRTREYYNPRPGCGRPGYGGPGGGTTINDNETVIFSEPGNNVRRNNNRQRGGRTTINDRETVVFDANSSNRNQRNNNNNNRQRTNRNQTRSNGPAMFGMAR